MNKNTVIVTQGAVARLPASDGYLFASGEHRVAGGDGIKLTRREASDCSLGAKFTTYRFDPG